ncbi:transposase [Azospirillum sp. sgz301742]
MQAMEVSHLTLSDPDSRLLRGAHGAVVGNNVQTAVDARHGLIVHHAVTQATSDQNQLVAMAEGAKQALETEALKLVADAGHADAEQLKACEQAGVTAFVPHPRTANPHGGFDCSRFVQDAENDTLRCPADGRLSHSRSAALSGRAPVRYHQAHDGRTVLAVPRAHRRGGGNCPERHRLQSQAR